MCTSIIVGKHATKDGVLIVARNEDYEQNNWNKYLFASRKPQYASEDSDKCCVGNMWRLGNGLEIPVPECSYKYCSAADAMGQQEAQCYIGNHYFFEERGINEKNVAISATNSMGINDLAQQADPTVSVGIEESIILTLILPQAESAKQAVSLLGKYVERYGAAEANGITFADVNEIWYMEIGSGHHWIAVKVPDNQYLAVANCMCIRGIDIDDRENVMHSRDIFSFVQQNKLLENPQRNNFDFAGAFGYPGQSGDPEGNPYYNVDRLWLAQKLLTPSLKQPVRQNEYPLFLCPDEPVTIEKVTEVLRATYKGTELEGIANRPIGVVRTAESHIMVLDWRMPEKLQGVIWQTMGTPLGSPYMPVFAAIERLPKQYAMGNTDYDEESAYWKFRGSFSLAYSNCMDEKEQITEYWKSAEQKIYAFYNLFCNGIKQNQEPDEKTMLEKAECFSSGVMEHLEALAKEKRNELLTEISVCQTD